MVDLLNRLIEWIAFRPPKNGDVIEALHEQYDASELTFSVEFRTADATNLNTRVDQINREFVLLHVGQLDRKTPEAGSDRQRGVPVFVGFDLLHHPLHLRPPAVLLARKHPI